MEGEELGTSWLFSSLSLNPRQLSLTPSRSLYMLGGGTDGNYAHLNDSTFLMLKLVLLPCLKLTSHILSKHLTKCLVLFLSLFIKMSKQKYSLFIVDFHIWFKLYVWLFGRVTFFSYANPSILQTLILSWLTPCNFTKDGETMQL